MNELTAKYGKSIIFTLLVIIIILAVLLNKSRNTITTESATPFPVENVKTFFQTLKDPKQNVHSILLLNPDGKLITYDVHELKRVEPCFDAPPPPDKKPVRIGEPLPPLRELPESCVKDSIEISDNIRVLTIRSGTRTVREANGIEKKESILFFEETDPRYWRFCTNPLGLPCT